jgi:hypothetical protein
MSRIIHDETQVDPVVAALAGAREKIQVGWTRGCLARNAYGESVTYDNPSATRWCAVGALRVAAGHMNLSSYDLQEVMGEAGNRLTTALQQLGHPPDISTVNDTARDKSVVLAVFDRAITIGP